MLKMDAPSLLHDDGPHYLECDGHDSDTERSYRGLTLEAPEIDKGICMSNMWMIIVNLR